jgi:hypothetical protein
MTTEISVRATTIVVKRGASRYVWDTTGLCANEGTKITSFEDGGFGDRWFIFFVEDCFMPSLHLIKDESFESAYEVFCDQEGKRGHYVVKDDDPDYTDKQKAEMWVDNNGNRLVTEAIQGFEVDFLWAGNITKE